MQVTSKIASETLFIKSKTKQPHLNSIHNFQHNRKTRTMQHTTLN
jgi:hypothetical protein